MTPKHTADDCDEDCRDCIVCYITRGGLEVCDKLCPHALPDEDDEQQ